MSERRLLRRHAWVCNQVWNFCAQIQHKVQRNRREGLHGKWLNFYALQALTVGVSQDLGIRAQTVQNVVEQFVRSRDQHKRKAGLPMGVNRIGTSKRIVIVESPFAGDVPRNLRYLRAALRDSLLRGEAPYASHAIYTQPGVLDDGVSSDRELGMTAGFQFKDIAEVSVVYQDLGISPGMQAGIDASVAKGYSYEYRQLGATWETEALEHEKTFKTRWP